MLKLYIGNKNYSSWSMRPWVLLKQAGIEFDEIMVRFDSFSAGSQFKNALTGVTPVGKVPVLVDGDLVVWDTLAIAEYVAERFPELHLGPDHALEALALLGNPPLLPVHWGTFALAMHDWDQPVERLLELAPGAGAQLVMPRLGEAIEPAHAETVTPWWRGAGSPLPAASRSDADSALPPQVPWPVD